VSSLEDKITIVVQGVTLDMFNELAKSYDTDKTSVFATQWNYLPDSFQPKPDNSKDLSFPNLKLKVGGIIFVKSHK
jgi:hypothetical protein